MTEDDLKAIEARARASSFVVGCEDGYEELGRTQRVLSKDVPALIAEVRRLQDRPRAQVCADHGCQVLPEHRHAALVDENAKDWASPSVNERQG
jgi:hypothetical protein